MDGVYEGYEQVFIGWDSFVYPLCLSVVRGWIARREYSQVTAKRHAAAVSIQTGNIGGWSEWDREIVDGRA